MCKPHSPVVWTAAGYKTRRRSLVRRLCQSERKARNRIRSGLTILFWREADSRIRSLTLILQTVLPFSNLFCWKTLGWAQPRLHCFLFQRRFQHAMIATCLAVLLQYWFERSEFPLKFVEGIRDDDNAIELWIIDARRGDQLGNKTERRTEHKQ